MHGDQNFEFDDIFIFRYSIVVEMISGVQQGLSDAYRYLTTIVVARELPYVVIPGDRSSLQSQSHNQSICL